MPAVGDVFAGKYRIERVLGAGGMGVVFAAVHLHLDERVALKVLRPTHVDDEDIVARFLREGRAAVKIRSEHVCRVIDVGADSGLPFLVLEYLDGTDLSKLVADASGLPIPVAVDYVLQACEAIAEAHARGVVHRDLKPSNLFLAKLHDGRSIVKVLDFGISKMVTPGELSQTTTDWFAGSPSYMSPEQLKRARDADARSDIWAIGTILFELITGSVPFRSSSFAELSLLVLSGTRPSARERRGDIPRELDAIIGRCLELEPAKRYASVRELVEELSPFGTAASSHEVSRVMGDAFASSPDMSTASAASLARTNDASPTTRAASTARLVAIGVVVTLLAATVARVATLRARTATAAASETVPPAVATIPPVVTSTAPPLPSSTAIEPAASSTNTEPVTAPRSPAAKPARAPVAPSSSPPRTNPARNKTPTEFTNDRRG